MFYVCSHDRAFMEQTCDRLLELDHGGFTTSHPFGGNGSYEAFKQARAARRHAQANAAADARTLLRRESEWMAKQPKVGARSWSTQLQSMYRRPRQATSVEVALPDTVYGMQTLPVLWPGMILQQCTCSACRSCVRQTPSGVPTSAVGRSLQGNGKFCPSCCWDTGRG